MNFRRAGLSLIVLLLSTLSVGCARFQSAPPPPQFSGIELLSSMQDALIEIVGRTRPAVVSIVARDVRQFNLRSQSQPKIIPRVDGTGFIYSSEGYIYTCAHVIHESKDIKVRLASGDTLEARIIGSDPGTDIAILKIESEKPLPILKLADSTRVRPGQLVVAIGHPFYLNFSATIGIVSATRRNLQDIVGYSLRSVDSIIRDENYIQTDAWINRGSSGGPLLDIHGEVLGMNSMIRAAKEGLSSGPGFAIPSEMLVKIGEELVKYGRVSRGWLGAGLQSHARGVRLSRVLTGTPADKAGLQVGDIILKYDGHDVPDRSWLQRAIANTKAGTMIPFTVLRANQVEVLNVVIGEMPPEYSGRSRPLSTGN